MESILVLFLFLCLIVGFCKIVSLILYFFSGKRRDAKNLENLKGEIAIAERRAAELHSSINDLARAKANAERELSSIRKDVEKNKEMYLGMVHAAQVFDALKSSSKSLAGEFDLSELASRTPEDLMCMQTKDLRALFRANKKQISNLVSTYQSKLGGKLNSAVFQLLILSLESEMREILRNLRFGKLESALADVHSLMLRYHSIANTGLLPLTASSLTKFVGQLEYFYVEAVRIEYEYYVKRERAREEQRALKEQMRQEAEERRILEARRKKMEAEEAKYEKEMTRIALLIASSSESSEIEKLRAQLEKVQSQLKDAQLKKEKIITLQNGKAGTVYVISNIGAFGDGVFKIGMTRRDDPMDRVKELGDASVPFPFDVHSFIFSNDAVSLETKLHHILNNDRVNKVNLRKEFFRVDIDRLQALVEELDPSAAFNRTALAEQFRQSLSVSEVPEEVDLSDLTDDDLQIDQIDE